LISSSLLRTYGCGQVDISYLKNNSLILVEVKSSVTGIESLKRSQLLRLKRSAALLESILDFEVKLKIIAKV